MNAPDPVSANLAARRKALAEALEAATDLDEAALEAIIRDLAARSDKARTALGLPEPPMRRLGRFQGLVTIGPAFFEPLPEEELKAWEGG